MSRVGSSGRVREDAGYSMVELMVILLIIAVLIAIAIPFFLGSQAKAKDRQAQSYLRTGLVAALTYWTDNDSFSGFAAGCTATPDSCTVAHGAEPSVTWVGPGDPAELEVSLVVASGDNLLIVSRSETGTYWCTAQAAGGTTHGQGSTFAAVDTIAECSNGW